MARTRGPHPDQIAFDWGAPKPATLPGSLAGSDRRAAETVAEIMRGDDREKIAAQMTVRMDEGISRDMLDAYASPARSGHNISFHRMLGLVAVTQRFDLLDRELRTIGAALLVGDEIYTAQASHIRSEIAQLTQQLKVIERMHPTITRNRRK